VLEGPLDMHDSPLWQAGAFHAQSRAAMHVARALAPHSGERVLDLCAAPGGKTTHLAALMEGRGQIVAVELNGRRAEELASTAKRLRAVNVGVEVGDAALTRPEGATFDRVLVDPPCSGLGTLQSRADLRWRITPAGMEQMAAQQAAVLAAGAAALRPGGVLVYSTCTISALENQGVVVEFLDRHPDFSLDDLAAELPAFDLARARPSPAESELGYGAASPSSGRTASGLVLTLPHRDHTAGFFIARLRRS
jgi:16S rRNA (cytosine967-C5)-methyltransferase